MSLPMKKYAQLATNVQGRTLQDLYLAITLDRNMTQADRQQLLNELDRIFGAYPKGTPLQSLLWKLGTGGIGFLIAKYFNLGPVGQGILAATGVGLGTLINNRLNRPQPYLSLAASL
jgi:hypothetical protein